MPKASKQCAAVSTQYGESRLPAHSGAVSNDAVDKITWCVCTNSCTNARPNSWYTSGEGGEGGSGGDGGGDRTGGGALGGRGQQKLSLYG